MRVVHKGLRSVLRACISAFRGYCECVKGMFNALEGYYDLCGAYHDVFGFIMSAFGERLLIALPQVSCTCASALYTHYAELTRSLVKHRV